MTEAIRRNLMDLGLHPRPTSPAVTISPQSEFAASSARAHLISTRNAHENTRGGKAGGHQQLSLRHAPNYSVDMPHRRPYISPVSNTGV